MRFQFPFSLAASVQGLGVRSSPLATSYLSPSLLTPAAFSVVQLCDNSDIRHVCGRMVVSGRGSESLEEFSPTFSDEARTEKADSPVHRLLGGGRNTFEFLCLC